MSSRTTTLEPVKPSVIICEQCVKPMRVRPEHARTPVICPHCGQLLHPWKMSNQPEHLSAKTEPGSMPWGEYYSPRNRWIAGILGVLLGPFGVHRFYLGFTRIAVLQLIVSFLTLGIGGLWGFIEGVLCLVSGHMRDYQGRPLRCTLPKWILSTENH